jgi:hypothetical protein
MKLKELLNLILNVAEKNKLSRPWIVGGLPRDKVLGREAEFKDLDLSTGDTDIHALGNLLLKPLEKFNPQYEILSDGHGRMSLGKLKIDFSNHFLIPGIERYNKAKSPMLQELYSRDFFCNTLLLNLELSQIYDPSGEGISDIKKKEIRTCLEPKITFGHDPKRLVRAIYLASKLNFQVEEKTKQFTGNVLNIAIDYGGRDEIMRAIQKIQEQHVDASTLTEENFNDYLDTAGEEYPNPDLIIRTSGEKRTSGLMPYQAAYAELLFLDKYFPDLTPQDIEQAIKDYSHRERRFGK